MKHSFEIDGNGFVQQLDDWTQLEQQRDRQARFVIVGVVLSLLVLGSYMISQMLR